MSGNREKSAELSGDAGLLPSENHVHRLATDKCTTLPIRLLDQKTIDNIIEEYLDLLDTSAAVFDPNGDYMGCRLSSGWCRLLNSASRENCATKNEQEAMKSGKWHCHESCWKASKTSIEKGKTVDIGCLGGIRLYAVPVFAKENIIGSINFGYSAPPKELKKLEVISKRYGIDVEKLSAAAHKYESRPPFMIDIFKKRLKVAAQLTGEMVTCKKMEIKQKALIKDLEGKNEELESFTYTVSHDLKNPLITIQGFLELLKKDLPSEMDEHAASDISRISSAATKMKQLLDDLLKLSRIGHVINPPEEISLSILAHEAVEMAMSRLRSKHVQVEIKPDLPMVYGDAVRIREVIENLVSNAVKFMGEQSDPVVEIGTRLDCDQTVITVRDNGIGIDPKYHEKVFEIFKRLETKVEGTGIGLAVVKRIIEAHEGRVWVESGEGHGATFCFTLSEKEEKHDSH